tara:strand:- start:53 stop:445 length:393 start_codon:yes stop_codon:yes gene_type:complete
MEDITRRLTLSELSQLTSEQKRERRKAYTKPFKDSKQKANIRAYYASKKTHYVIYKHTNSEGQMYIGSGWNTRPYKLHKTARSSQWNRAFKGVPLCIEIIDTFNNIEAARASESALIAKIGLNNLVNIRH